MIRFFCPVFIALIGSVVAHAANTAEIVEHHCVSASAPAVQTLFTQYDQYSRMPGAVYSTTLAGVEVDLIRMVKSQAKSVSKDPSNLESLVWIVLQPALIEDGALYPRFLLDCKVSSSGKAGFKQNCALQKDKQHFGLEDLTLSVQGFSQDSRCKVNQTGIDLRVKLVPNSAHISQIRTAMLGPAGVLAPLISALFDEDAFFQNYFHFIYGEWIKTL